MAHHAETGALNVPSRNEGKQWGRNDAESYGICNAAVTGSRVPNASQTKFARVQFSFSSGVLQPGGEFSVIPQAPGWVVEVAVSALEGGRVMDPYRLEVVQCER